MSTVVAFSALPATVFSSVLIGLIVGSGSCCLSTTLAVTGWYSFSPPSAPVTAKFILLVFYSDVKTISSFLAGLIVESFI